MPRPARHPRRALVDGIKRNAAGVAAHGRRQIGIEDANGNLRVAIGDLGAFYPGYEGEYGVVVASPAGAGGELWPPVCGQYVGVGTFTPGGSPATLGGGWMPEVWIGVSAEANITISGTFYGTAGTGTTAPRLVPVINGTAYDALTSSCYQPVLNDYASAAITFPSQGNFTLEPGAANTFQLAVNASSGTVYVGMASLLVQPL